MANSDYGSLLLKKQLKEINKNNIDYFSVGLKEDNLFEWNVMMEGPPETIYEGGYFQCTLKFPKEYPNKPPVMTINTPGFWHPNVYENGVVCISILHEAKEDAFNEQEKMSEKWRPIIGVEAVLMSVLSMLSAPNLDSPANVDAAVMFKNDYDVYKKKVRKVVRYSVDNL